MRKLMGYELRKLFGRRLTQAALLAAVLFSTLFTVSTYQNKYASYGGRQASGGEAVALDKEVAARYAGELTDEKVRQMMDELAPKSGPQGLNAIYLYQNAMQSAVTARFSDMYGNWNGLRVAQVFGEEEIRIGYVDGWLSASRDMEKSFLFLSFAILIMLAPVYSGEYGGVDNLILASRYGRTKCASAKALAGILAAVLVTAGMLACNVGAAYVWQGGPGRQHPVRAAGFDGGLYPLQHHLRCPAGIPGAAWPDRGGVHGGSRAGALGGLQNPHDSRGGFRSGPHCAHAAACGRVQPAVQAFGAAAGLSDAV